MQRIYTSDPLHHERAVGTGIESFETAAVNMCQNEPAQDEEEVHQQVSIGEHWGDTRMTQHREEDHSMEAHNTERSKAPEGSQRYEVGSVVCVVGRNRSGYLVHM